ncbi:MAG: kelch repeat-containing protein [Bacteroidales bacterium]
MKALIAKSIKLMIAAIIPIFLLYSCIKCKEDPIITSFAFTELYPAATGEINHEDGTIVVEVPELTDVTNLSPAVKVGNPECHTLSPLSGTPQDFSETIIYEVTNEVEDARQYEVSVTFGQPVASMDITWETKAPLPVEVGWMPAVELDGKIYVIGGGVDETATTDKMYVYDPVTDTWDDTRASIPTARCAHRAEVVNGKIYVMGGVPGVPADALEDIQVYDPQTDTWQTAGNMPIRRAAFGSCVIDDKIYLIGGELEEYTENVIADVSVYDPATGKWTSLAPLPTARCYLTADVINGKIYAAGGTTEIADLGFDIVEVYDPVTDRWEEGSAMPQGKWGHRACVINDKIIYAGGAPMFATPGTTTIQIFSASENKWYKGTKMEFPRLATPVCTLDGRVYIIGGCVSGPPWATNTDDLTVGLPDF